MIAALVVALLVAIGAAIWGWVDRPSAASASAEASPAAALTAAQQVAVDLTTFDYRKLDESWARLEAESTPSFMDSLAANKSDVEAFDKRMKVISSGTVTASAALPPAADGRVTVLLFVDQRLYSLGSTTGEIQPARIQLVMTQAQGAWLADEVTVTNLGPQAQAAH